MDQFFWCVMVFSILVAEFKLGAPFLHQSLFCVIQFTHFPYPVVAMIIAALVDGDLFPLFPGKQRMVAVGAVILRFHSPLASPVQLEQVITHLALQLGSLFAIVVIEIAMGCATAGTTGMLRYPGRA